MLFGEIYRVDLSGRRLNLSRSPSDDISPVVSPDGRWTAFASDRGHVAALYVVRLDGSGLRRISRRLFSVGESGAVAAQISWSPDSRRVAVTASGSYPVQILYITGLGGHGRVISGNADTPLWSPDGHLLAYTHFPGGPSNMNEVRIVTSTGDAVWRVRGKGLRHPAWSRSGRLALGVGGRTIRVYDRNGRLLSSFPGQAFAWSPGGSRLASLNAGRLEVRVNGTGLPILSVRVLAPSQIFTQGAENPVVWTGKNRVRISSDVGWKGVDVSTGKTLRPEQNLQQTSADSSLVVRQTPAGTNVDLEVAARNGSNRRTVARAPACAGGAPFGNVQFTPDGRSLVYQSDCREPSADLYAIAADGTGLRRLTHTREHEVSPSLSPDGRSVAYSRLDAAGLNCHGCPGTIWVMDASGRHQRELTQPTEAYDGSPSWSPDGREILFSRSSATRPGELFVVPVAGGKARDLHIAGEAPVWGPRRIAYIGRDGPSIWTIAADGTDRRKIASGSTPLCLGWSSDGRLAYVDSFANDVVVVIVGKTTRSFRLPLRLPASLTWSPDGKTLLLSPAVTAAGPTELYSIGTDGKGFTRFTSRMGATHGVTWR